jgi:hypothetical protein
VEFGGVVGFLFISSSPCEARVRCGGVGYVDCVGWKKSSLRSSDHAFLTFGSAYRRLPKQA